MTMAPDNPLTALEERLQGFHRNDRGSFLGTDNITRTATFNCPEAYHGVTFVREDVYEAAVKELKELRDKLTAANFKTMSRRELALKAYKAGVSRVCGFDTNRITEAEILEAHETEDVDTVLQVVKPKKLYVYDCDRGQGSVMAHSIEEARNEAVLDCGRNDPPRNVHLATAEEIAFRQAMGGRRHERA